MRLVVGSAPGANKQGLEISRFLIHGTTQMVYIGYDLGPIYVSRWRCSYDSLGCGKKICGLAVVVTCQNIYEWTMVKQHSKSGPRSYLFTYFETKNWFVNSTEENDGAKKNQRALDVTALAMPLK
jgi:hypothetical protein